MPCWPDIWEHAKQVLPGVGLAVSGVALVAIVALLLWAPKLSQRWMRVTSRVIGGIGVGALVIVLPAILFGMMLANGNPPPEKRMVKATNGDEATLIYQGGFLGRDFTEVTLKSNSCCRHIRVFSHSGPSEFDDPQLEWIGVNHLQVTYHARVSDPEYCAQQLGNISITCTKLIWPETPKNDHSTERPDDIKKESK